MTHKIHPSACVDPKATLGKNVSIGPFCVVGPHVVIGDHTILHSHVVVEGHTTIGKHTQIFPFASIGHIPQDLKYDNEPSTLEIGDYNVIREHVTMNPGTKGGEMTTKIGHHCLFMMGSHVAHDCMVGNYVIMANNATLGGHVTIGNYAIIGGLAAIHQFCRIGEHAIIGGLSPVVGDVIPFGQVSGDRANLDGINLVGLKRRKFSRDDIHTLRAAYKMMFASGWGHFSERVEEAEANFKDNANVMEVIQFIKKESSRAVCQPKGRLNNDEETA